MWKIEPPNYGLIGHRGAIERAPENTMASFIQAQDIGLDMVEFDIRLTSDHQWVVFHDDDTLRLTGEHLITRDSTAEALSKLRVAKAHPIPLFSSLLPQMFKLGMRMNIEIKTVPADRQLALTKFLPIIANWPSKAPLPLVSSFDHGLIRALRQHCPDLHLGLLSHKNEVALFDQAKELTRCAVHFDVDLAQDSDLTAAELAGVPLLYFTVNNLTMIKRLKSGGAWGLFTDQAASIIDEL